MRILQIHASYRETGGEDRVVAQEAAALRRLGHDVVPWHVENPSGALGAATSLAMAPWNPTTHRRARELVRTVQPHVVHVHNTWFALSPSILRPLHEAGLPVVMTLHNYRVVCSNGLLFRDGHPCEDCLVGSTWNAVRHRCYRGSAIASTAAAATIASSRRGKSWNDLVDVFLAPTAFTRDKLVESGLGPEKVRVHHHFVDDPGPRPAPPSASDTVLFVGRLSPEKGVDVLLEAWRMLATDRLRLDIVGSGPLEPSVRAKLPPTARMVGSLAPHDVRELMLRARALVFPSQLYETFGLVVMEAMAAGLPVLVPDLGAPRELVAACDERVRIPPRAPERWADGIGMLLDDVVADRMGREARAAYVAGFTEQSAMSTLERMYEHLVSGRSPGPERSRRAVGER